MSLLRIAALSKTIEGLVTMETEILKGQVDFVLVNTDGLVDGDVAVKYKVDLVKSLNPDFIIGIQKQGELAPLINCLEIPVFIVEPSFALNPRTPEKRKTPQRNDLC